MLRLFFAHAACGNTTDLEACALRGLEVGLLIGLLFTACMVSLSGSLVAFIRDMNLSLEALKLELGRQTPKD